MLFVVILDSYGTFWFMILKYFSFFFFLLSQAVIQAILVSNSYTVLDLKVLFGLKMPETHISHGYQLIRVPLYNKKYPTSNFWIMAYLRQCLDTHKEGYFQHSTGHRWITY